MEATASRLQVRGHLGLQGCSQPAWLTISASPPTQPTSSPTSGPTLHEDIYNLPNILTFSRIAAAPFIGYFVLHDQHAWALGLFAYAGISDLLDGYIARRWNMRTVVGTVIDPMADKMLMTVLTVSLAAKGALPRMGPLPPPAPACRHDPSTQCFDVSLCKGRN